MSLCLSHADDPGSSPEAGSRHLCVAGLTENLSVKTSGSERQTGCLCWEGSGQMLGLVGRRLSTLQAPLPAVGSALREPVASSAATPPGQEEKDKSMNENI